MKFGVIGYGSIGRRHADNLAKSGVATLICDPAHPAAKPIDQLLEQSDAFVIASPTANHYEHLMACLPTGRPIFVEKPIAATRQQWLALSETANIDNVLVGYNLRFRACVDKAKTELGFLSSNPLWAHFVCAQLSEKPEYLRDGVILNWSHEIDLALHLLGPGKVVSCAVKETDGKETMADIIIEHTNGCRSAIHLDYLSDPEERGFTIKTPNGLIGVDIPTNSCSVTRSNYTFQKTWNETFDQNYIMEINSFVGHCYIGRMLRGCHGREALAVLDVCLSAKEQAGLA